MPRGKPLWLRTGAYSCSNGSVDATAASGKTGKFKTLKPQKFSFPGSIPRYNFWIQPTMAVSQAGSSAACRQTCSTYGSSTSAGDPTPVAGRGLGLGIRGMSLWKLATPSIASDTSTLIPNMCPIQSILMHMTHKWITLAYTEWMRFSVASLNDTQGLTIAAPMRSPLVGKATPCRLLTVAPTQQYPIRSTNGIFLWMIG